MEEQHQTLTSSAAGPIDHEANVPQQPMSTAAHLNCRQFANQLLIFHNCDNPSPAFLAAALIQAVTYVALFFYIFVSACMIWIDYATVEVQLGPNTSYLIEENWMFVNYVKVEQIGDDQTVGPILYGFHKAPSLDGNITWSQNHNASVKPFSYLNWTYYLNAGSRINISYDVRPAPLTLIVAQGNDSFAVRMNDTMYEDAKVSQKIIFGRGNFEQNITHSGVCYVAVVNQKSETTKVVLNNTMNSLLYNTSDAQSKCPLIDHVCSFKMLLWKPNAAIITTPSPEEVNADKKWYIRLSYETQWITYIAGAWIVIALIVAATMIASALNPPPPTLSLQPTAETEPLISQGGNNSSLQPTAETEPLISQGGNNSSLQPTAETEPLISQGGNNSSSSSVGSSGQTSRAKKGPKRSVHKKGGLLPRDHQLAPIPEEDDDDDDDDDD